MPEAISIEVQGMAELEQALLEMGNALAGKELFGGLMDAALPIQKAAQALAPVADKPHYQYTRKKGQRIQIQPGNLRKSIRRKRLKSRDGQTGAQVGISWTGRAFYGRFREFGTSKEPAKPFLRPAFEAKKDDALRIFRGRLETRIEKQRQIAAARTGHL